MFQPDIEVKIKEQYGGNIPEVLNLLNLINSNDAGGYRVIRCVLALAQGNMNKLKELTELASKDWRDVIYWAEYDKSGNQIADYTKPFKN